MRALSALLVVLFVPALAGAQRTPSHIKRTNPPALSRPTGYTHVVELSGPVRTIYIAGQVAADRDGNVVGGTDMKAQAEQVFKNLESALAAAGATFADVVRMNTSATDLTNVQARRLGFGCMGISLGYGPATSRDEGIAVAALQSEYSLSL
jgi:enamine deaminase RidA (YjgF/YER057c/UK114 family)